MSRHVRLLDQEMFGEEITPEDLADRLGDLRYDALADYLAALAEKLQRDSRSDGGRGRGKLATYLLGASVSLSRAVESIEDAWDICEPYMVSKDATEKSDG
jgi:hypothetical protein